MSDLPPPPGPPPGWYPDPTTGVGFRWWNGAAWTEETSQTPGQPGTGLTPVGEWMSQVLRLAITRAGHFLPMIVIMTVPATLANGLSLWYGLRDAVLTADTEVGTFEFTNPSGTAGAYALIALTAVARLVGAVLLAVAVVRHAQAALEDRTELWSTSVLDGLRRAGRAIGVAAAVLAMLSGAYLVMLASATVSPLLVIVTFPVWIVASLLVVTRFSLAPVAAALSPAGVGSLATSWALTASRFWAVLGRMVLLAIVGASLWLVAGLVAAPFTALAGGGAETALEPGSNELPIGELFGDNPATFAIGQLFGALGSGASTVVWAIGLALIYRNLAGPAEGERAEIEGVP